MILLEQLVQVLLPLICGHLVLVDLAHIEGEPCGAVDSLAFVIMFSLFFAFFTPVSCLASGWIWTAFLIQTGVDSLTNINER